MPKAVRIGIIGCGHICNAHMNAYKELTEKGLFQNVRIEALCDANIDNALRFRKRGDGLAPLPGVGPANDPMNSPHVYVSDFQPDYTPVVFDDFQQLLDRANINTVVVLTSVPSHHTIAIAAMKAGKNVFVEKPIAISVKAARLMIEAAEKYGVKLGVAESFRYHLKTRLLEWVISNRYIGDIQTVFAVNMGGFWAPDKIVAETAWRHNRFMAGGGISIDCGVHNFNLLRHVVGEIEEIYAVTKMLEPYRYMYDESKNIKEQVKCNADDTMALLMKFKNGAIGLRLQSWAGHAGATNLPLTIYGTKGHTGGSDILFRDGIEPVAIRELFEEAASNEIKEKYFPNGITNLFALENLDFINWVRGGPKMESDGYEGLVDLAACYAVLESSLTGKAVRVKDVVEGKLHTYEDSINSHYNILGG